MDWKMFLLSFLFVSAVAFWLLLRPEGGLCVSNKVTKGWSMWWVLTGVIVALVWYNWDDINFCHTRTSPHRNVARYTEPQATPQQQVANEGMLAWYQQNTKGNGDQTDVKIERNDDKVMEFTSKYNTHYIWDKSKEYGEWYQDYPKDSGKWYLEQKGEKSFEGWISDDKDKSGTRNQMKLEVNK